MTTMTRALETEYQGIKIRAGSNLHQEVFRLIQGLGLPAGTEALDIGAGEGAFSRRLMDHGFKVTAIELEPERFQAGAKCLTLDLNREFHSALGQRFGLIVAMEIAEHLRDPRHLLEQCLAVLEPNGYLVMSSPNVESWLSRLRFLREGRFLWFDESAYHSVGHITPILTWQVAQICGEKNAELVRVEHTRNHYLWRHLGDGWRRVFNKSLWLGMFYPFMQGRRDGEVNIYLIRPRG